ncbi:MAG: hypothetical protein ACPG05_03590 [Bdellovibrionales bacterium]
MSAISSWGVIFPETLCTMRREKITNRKMLRTINPLLKQQEALRGVEEFRRARAFLWIWVIYIFLSPFYIFSSGTPQPADMVVFTGILAFFSYALLKPN